MNQPNNEGKRLQKMLRPINPVWKRKSIIAPFCPICKDALLGNNSSANPYKCSCGEWEMDMNSSFDMNVYYKIKIKSL